MGDAWNIFSILQLFIWMFTTWAGRGVLCLVIGALIHARGGPDILSTLALVGGAVFWGIGVYGWGKRSKRW